MKSLVRRFINPSRGRIAYGEKGFTLVELLVVVAILGILAAVAVPSLSGLTAKAKINAAKAELSTVQTSVDAMMADKGVSAVGNTTATKTMSAFPAIAGSSAYIHPNYIRTETTSYTYSCDTTGLVTQTDTPAP